MRTALATTKPLPAEAGRFDFRERRTEVLWLTIS